MFYELTFSYKKSHLHSKFFFLAHNFEVSVSVFSTKKRKTETETSKKLVKGLDYGDHLTSEGKYG